MSFHGKRMIGIGTLDIMTKYGSHAGFYQRFIKYLSHISKPPNLLLQKETPFVCFKAFEVIKDKNISAPIIIPELAIHYANKMLNMAQCNYTTTKKGILAVVFICQKF
ncbi:Transposon Ty3-I Gag-Pol polyprotein [Gossypium australe]|uniref:Transposon Ty3-I Gag-Pol polyprotein n=1 Tax=Gossypium australe TaxID=47621 RepID=A0A5B6UCV5_9ROSI|nr:Transposon Ty3-I Gag-Pol polyprotein [Gossypium australe]